MLWAFMSWARGRERNVGEGESAAEPRPADCGRSLWARVAGLFSSFERGGSGEGVIRADEANSSAATLYIGADLNARPAAQRRGVTKGEMEQDLGPRDRIKTPVCSNRESGGPQHTLANCRSENLLMPGSLRRDSLFRQVRQRSHLNDSAR